MLILCRNVLFYFILHYIPFHFICRIRKWFIAIYADWLWLDSQTSTCLETWWRHPQFADRYSKISLPSTWQDSTSLCYLCFMLIYTFLYQHSILLIYFIFNVKDIFKATGGIQLHIRWVNRKISSLYMVFLCFSFSTLFADITSLPY